MRNSLYRMLISFPECNDLIYGCLSCQLEDDANGDEFPVCTSCMSGLFLLANATNSDLYPSTHSFCVPDCRQAHSSYVDDISTGKCRCKFLSHTQGAETTVPLATTRQAVRFAQRLTRFSLTPTLSTRLAI